MTAISAARDVLSIRLPTHPRSAGSRVSDPRIIISTPIDGGDRHARDEAEADHRQAHQRDDHRDPGEQDGPSTGVHRLDDGFLDVQSEAEPLAVASDDEQRVVDADAESDHGDHRGHEVGHRDHVAEQRDQREADAKTEQGGADRQPHRQHRAEGQDQDDDGGDDAEDLALGQLELAEEVTAVLDRQALDRRLLLTELLDRVAQLGDLLEVADRSRRAGRRRSCRPG